MGTTQEITPERILSLERNISNFKQRIIGLELLAGEIDSQVYGMNDNDVFQFEDYNLNEGLGLLDSILSRRIQFLNKIVGINEKHN